MTPAEDAHPREGSLWDIKPGNILIQAGEPLKPTDRNPLDTLRLPFHAKFEI